MTDTPISDGIQKYEADYGSTHAHGSLHIDTIREFERLRGNHLFGFSVETGCGKSTILLSNISDSHLVFCLDDRSLGNTSSVNYFLSCGVSREDRVDFIYGPSLENLSNYRFPQKIDFALIDGPHGFPFPYVEYFYIYPHLRAGAFLIIDDIQIPSIRPLWEIVAEDQMFEVYKIVGNKTGILRRTSSPTFDPAGDGWWEQRYNRRRVPPTNQYYLPN